MTQTEVSVHSSPKEDDYQTLHHNNLTHEDNLKEKEHNSTSNMMNENTHETSLKLSKIPIRTP